MIGRACKALCCVARGADCDFYFGVVLIVSEIMLLAISAGLMSNHFSASAFVAKPL